MYEIPVRKYSELLDQIPSYVYADGDGTVTTVQALGDEFPDCVVGDRYVVPGFLHVPMLSDPRLFELIASLVRPQ